MTQHRLFLSSLLFCMFSFALAEDLTPGFYNSVNGKKDAELKGGLKSLIRDHTAIDYGSGKGHSWEVFYYSDRNDEGYCMDMYCDTWYKFGTPGSVVTGCNIEHSFAKSWWGGNTNDAYKDCYHLNPSNSNANNARSNYPLGVPVKDIKTSGSLKVGKRHHDQLNVDFLSLNRKTNTRAISPAPISIWQHAMGAMPTEISTMYVLNIKDGAQTTKMSVPSTPCRTTTTWSSSLGNRRFLSNGTAWTPFLKRKSNALMPSAISNTTAIHLSTILIWQNISGARKPDRRST